MSLEIENLELKAMIDEMCAIYHQNEKELKIQPMTNFESYKFNEQIEEFTD